MNKVVVNGCYGGFSLSHEAVLRYCEVKGITVCPEEVTYGYTYWLDENKSEYFSSRSIERHDPVLIQVVEELGERANGQFAHLCVEQIDGDRYYIEEYDGCETIRTPDDNGWVVIEGETK